jgi:hypothetical protein
MIGEVFVGIGIAVISLLLAIVITIVFRILLSLTGLVSFTDYKTNTTNSGNNPRHNLT